MSGVKGMGPSNDRRGKGKESKRILDYKKKKTIAYWGHYEGRTLLERKGKLKE